jgi:hypothetical protein
LKVNAKKSFCPECGRELQPEVQAAAAAESTAVAEPSKMDKLKGVTGGLFRR